MKRQCSIMTGHALNSLGLIVVRISIKAGPLGVRRAILCAIREGERALTRLKHRSDFSRPNQIQGVCARASVIDNKRNRPNHLLIILVACKERWLCRPCIAADGGRFRRSNVKVLRLCRTAVKTSTTCRKMMGAAVLASSIFTYENSQTRHSRHTACGAFGAQRGKWGTQ